MTLVVTTKDDFKAAIRALRTAPQRAFESAKHSFNVIGLRWERDMKGRFVPYSRGSGLFDRNPSRKTVRSRSGNLKKSLRTNVSGDNLGSLVLRMRAGSRSNEAYANLQEYGGTIRSKGKLLTVPTIYALSSRGLITPQASLVAGGGKTQSGLDVYASKSSGGHLFLFARQPGVEGPGVPIYGLMKRVKVPARLGMRATRKKLMKEEVHIMIKSIARSTWPTEILKHAAGGGL